MVIYMFLNSLAIKCIKKYQQNKAIIGSGRCKHYPSCSNYAIGCYEKFNFIKASFLTLFRIIRCNPFTRKMYDPVPLTRKEKIALKEKQKSLKLFNPYLLNEFKNYPLMQVQDFITYIYEATFGSYYLKENNLSVDDFSKLLKQSNHENELITDEYVKIYNTNEYTTLYDSLQTLEMSDTQIQLFNERLYLFKKLVKKKLLPFNYKQTYNDINNYLSHGITYLGHSNIYINNYTTDYIVVKNNLKKAYPID